MARWRTTGHQSISSIGGDSGGCRRQQLTPKATVQWVQQQRVLANDDGDEHRQIRLESDEDSVTVTTIHRSKGLQYGFVWCPSLLIAASIPAGKQRPLRFRNAAHGNEWWLDIGLDEKAPSKRNHIEMALTTQREESLRRLYVALTRARHQVHVMVSGTEKIGQVTPRLHTVSPTRGATIFRILYRRCLGCAHTVGCGC